MGVVALITWLSTAGAGLYLVAVWLIEYDREFQSAAKTRLPIPVVSAHALLAVTGLVVWGAYLFTDSELLAWTALAILGAVVALGLTMAARWLRIVRQPAPEPSARPAGISTVAPAGLGFPPGPRPAEASPGPDARDAWDRRDAAQAAAVPPERNFPVPIVILHGVLALATVTLVTISIFHGS
jgi:hypothetical protein